jgi:hypothetical protein
MTERLTEPEVTSRARRREERARRKAARNALRRDAGRRRHSAARGAAARAAERAAGRPKPWFLRWYGLLTGCAALVAYWFLGGPRLNGRIVVAVVGDDNWVQGVAGWLWFFTLGALYDRAGAGAFGSGRGRKVADWTASLMLFFAWTFAPIGRGLSAGVPSVELTGAAEAPGFAMGLMVALPTTGLGYWLVNRRKWKEQKLDRDAGLQADADAGRFGIRHAATGRQILHPEWLKPEDRPTYAKRVRDEYLVPAEDLAPHELVYLEEGLREARRAPRELLLPLAERKRRRKRTD